LSTFGNLATAATLAAFSVVSAHAIVVTGPIANSADVTYGTPVGNVNLSGVVAVQSSIGGCSGTLLSDGLSILTAGHCVTPAYGTAPVTDATVYFTGPSGLVSRAVSSVTVNPGWSGDASQGGDLAVLLLSTPAPAFASGYDLYTGDPAFNSPLILAGYGLNGTGDTGASVPNSYGKLRAGENEYAGTGASIFNWSASLLIGQFYDSSNSDTNALGLLNPFAAVDEVDIAHGDSGGPSFYNGQIIGVHDVIICKDDSDHSACATPPSVSASNNSYFGQLFGDTSVSAYTTWISAQEVVFTPEPATLWILAGGLCLIALDFRRRKSQSSAKAIPQKL